MVKVRIQPMDKYSKFVTRTHRGYCPRISRQTASARVMGVDAQQLPAHHEKERVIEPRMRRSQDGSRVLEMLGDPSSSLMGHVMTSPAMISPAFFGEFPPPIIIQVLAHSP